MGNIRKPLQKAGKRRGNWGRGKQKAEGESWKAVEEPWKAVEETHKAVEENKFTSEENWISSKEKLDLGLGISGFSQDIL